jgi:poly(A) polymerase
MGDGAAAVARRRAGARRNRGGAGGGGRAGLAAAWRLGGEAARDAALVRAASVGAAPPADLEAEIARGEAAVFPLASKDLGLEGPALGRALKRLEELWVASDFRLDAKALLRAAGEG